MRLNGAQATGESWRDNYQTPPYILEVVENLFGPGYFDPCPANPSFDGLSSPWGPRAFINPPFSQYSKWVSKGQQELDAGLFAEQIWLSHAQTSTKWYQSLLGAASAVCLLKKRVVFIDPRTGEPCKTSCYGKSQVLTYVGPRPTAFACKAQTLGPVLYPSGSFHVRGAEQKI